MGIHIACHSSIPASKSIKDFKRDEVNEALLLEQAWRILNETESLRAVSSSIFS